MAVAPTFQDYYEQHTGRGVWKWNVALDAYQRHFNSFASKAGSMLEIGVQSGGSINMYHAVLPNLYYYGMDINRNCEAFKDATTTIYLGDQASVPGWLHFFSAVATQGLDICIDDGGHQAHQMLATIQQVLPHMNQGGFFLTEDIHGVNDDYLSKFFHPAADAIGFSHLVDSVHLYPFVLGVQMVPGVWQPPAAVATYSTFADLMKSLPQHLGTAVKLENSAWGANWLTADALKNFFNTFYNIYEGVVRQEPEHCHNGMADTCAMIVTNTEQQNLVKGVHIYKTHAIVEVHAAPPVIAAYRKGSQWIAYNGP